MLAPHRTSITSFSNGRIQFIRANFWNAAGQYSSKTFTTAGEAHHWLNTRKLKEPIL